MRKKYIQDIYSEKLLAGDMIVCDGCLRSVVARKEIRKARRKSAK